MAEQDALPLLINVFPLLFSRFSLFFLAFSIQAPSCRQLCCSLRFKKFIGSIRVSKIEKSDKRVLRFVGNASGEIQMGNLKTAPSYEI